MAIDAWQSISIYSIAFDNDDRDEDDVDENDAAADIDDI